MTAEEIAALRPGDRIRWVARPHARYTPGDRIVTLSHRKEDGSGWWNTDGTGVDDRLALATDSWELVR